MSWQDDPIIPAPTAVAPVQSPVQSAVQSAPWQNDPIIQPPQPQQENYPSEIPPPELLQNSATAAPGTVDMSLWQQQINQNVDQRLAEQERARQQRAAVDFQQQQAQRWLEGMPQIDVGLPEQQAAQYAARSQYLTHQPPAIDQLNPAQQQNVAAQFAEQYQQGAPLGVDTLTNIGQKLARAPARINQGLNFLDELMGGGQTPEQNQQDRQILDRYGSPPATTGAKVVETAASILPIAAASAVGGPGAGAAVALADVGSQVEDAAKRALIAQGKDPDDPANLALLKGAIQGAYAAATMFLGGGGGNGLAQVGKQAAIGSAIEAGSQLGQFIEGRKPDLEAILYSGATMGALHALFHPIEAVRGGIDAAKAGREQLARLNQEKPAGVINWNNPQQRAAALKEIEANLPQGEENARQIQSPAQVGEQPGGPQSTGRGGSEGVERGQQAPPIAREGDQAAIEQQQRAAQEQAPPQPAQAEGQGTLYENLPRVAPTYETHGWKLHLATDNPEEVSAYLKEQGIPHKVGHNSGQEGKDVTVYIGDRQLAEQTARDIEANVGDLLKAPTGDALADDRQFTPKVMGRFEVSGKAPEFHQYGTKGIPFLKEDMQARVFDPQNFNEGEALKRSHEALTRKYGDFYEPSQPTEPAPANQHEIRPEQRSASEEGQGASDRVIPETPPHEGNVPPPIKVGDLITWTDPADRTSTLSGKVLKATDRAFVVDRGDGQGSLYENVFRVTAYRGEPASGTTAGPGADKFYSADRAEAAKYGEVKEETLTFNNPLRAENWMDAKPMLGLEKSATMPEVIEAARAAGHDGIIWSHHGKEEYVKLEPSPRLTPAPQQLEVRPDQARPNQEGQSANQGMVEEAPHEQNVPPPIKVGDLITWTDPADRSSTLSGKVLKATDRAFVVDRGDGQKQFIRAENVIEHTPQEQPAFTGRGPKGYTKAEIEQKLLNHLSETGGVQDSAEQSNLDRAASGDAFAFRDKLPEEIKVLLEGRPNLRRLVRVYKPGKAGYANAGGADAIGEMGEDKYLAHLERAAGNNLPKAIDAAENSQDPQMQFLAAFYKHIQPGGERRPQQLINPDNYATGTELEIHGEKFHIIDTGEGWRALKDGKEYPILPVEALDKIPVDKGSIKMGREADLEREPFRPGEELGFGQGRGRPGAPTPEQEPNQPQQVEARRKPSPLKQALYGENSFIGQDVIPTALDAAKGLRDAADDVRKVFAPQTRGEQAKQTQGIIREMGARLAQRSDRAEAALHEASKLFDGRSREANLRYIDNIENGRPQGEPQTESISRLMRELLDGRREEVRALGTGKLEHYNEDYYPHIWKDPAKAAQIFGGKRPMEGSKSFLKKRTIPTIAEGVKLGLEPISDNPVDMTLIKLREMDRYILSQKALAELKQKMLVKFVPAMEKGPDGYAKIDDRIAKVYGPPALKTQEWVDKTVYEALSQTARNLGIEHNRVPNAGRDKLGFSVTGGDKVVTQANTELSVLAHEIGHQLDEKFGMFDRFFNNPDDNLRPVLKKEMRNIADLTERGKNSRKREEQIAQIVEAYVHARDRMQEVAPYTAWEFEKMIHDHPELQPLMERPSLALKKLNGKLPHHGLLLMGEYQAPEEVARLLNNYLSPGIRQHSAVFRAMMGIGNVLNQAQLGLSAFHVGFTSNDAVTSKVSLAIEQAVHGNLPSAVKSALEAPAAQVTTYLKGRKLREEWMRPGSQGEEMGQIVDAMVAAGGRAQQDPLYKTQFGRNMMKALRSGNIVGAALRLPLAINEVPGRFLLEHVVPLQKLGVFYDMARMELGKLGPGATRDKVREVLGKAWDSVDNRMGQIVYDNLFWNKTAKELAMVTVRSVGWNLGTVREGVGAALDTAKAVGQLARGQKPEFTRRMAYAVALPLVTAMTGALYQYMRTGEPPKDTKDLFFPRTGEIDATGHEIRTALPTYMKDVFHAVEEPRKTLTNKLHPLIGMIADMLQNEDYYGTQIRNADDPIMKQITDELKYVGEQFVPFSIRGLQKANENPNTKTIDKVLPFIGINQAPQYISLSSAEKMAEDLAAEKFPRGARTRAEADRALQKAKLVKEERSGVPEAQDDVRSAINSGQMNAMDAKSIYRRSHESPLLYHVKQLAADDAMRVWRVATDAEKKDIRPVIMGKIARSQRLPAEQRTAMMRELGAANLAAGVPNN